MPRPEAPEARAAQPVGWLAHLSDLHLFEPRALGLGVATDQRLLGGINALLRRRRQYRREIIAAAVAALTKWRPAHVVITGDLSTLGARAELEAGLGLLAPLPLGPRDVTVLPGNHDAYTRALWRAGHFARVFGPHQVADPPWDGPDWPRVRRRGPFALIGCSTACPSPPLWAVGRLGTRQLARLEATLADPRLAACARVVALHHPPQPGVGHYHNRLIDAAELRAVLARQGAALVLHGHLHRDLRTELPGPDRPIPVRGVPAAGSASHRPERRAGIGLYRLEGGRLVSEVHLTYQPESGEFTA